MIISRAPVRISFFGGGTDYPEYFLKHGGTVLASAIEEDPGARLPGTRRLALREAAARDGVTVDAELLDEVRQLGAS